MFCFDNCEFEGKVPNTDVMLQCGTDTDDDKSCPFRSWLHVSCLRARGEEPALTESAPVYICEYCRYFKDITETKKTELTQSLCCCIGSCLQEMASNKKNIHETISHLLLSAATLLQMRIIVEGTVVLTMVAIDPFCGSAAKGTMHLSKLMVSDVFNDR